MMSSLPILAREITALLKVLMVFPLSAYSIPINPTGFQNICLFTLKWFVVVPRHYKIQPKEIGRAHV